MIARLSWSWQSNNCLFIDKCLLSNLYCDVIIVIMVMRLECNVSYYIPVCHVFELAYFYDHVISLAVMVS